MPKSSVFYQQHLKGLHSHNDQEQAVPLTDALALDYESIEVDVFLVTGVPKVGHTLGEATANGTLEAEYLDPLAALDPSEHPTQLCIDLKTSPSDTLFTTIVSLLESYPEFADGHMLVVFTGNQPVTPSAHPNWIKFGRARSRLNLLDPEVAVIEVNFTSVSTWDGGAPAPLDVIEILRLYANEAHVVNKQLRVYAAPSTIISWLTQYDAGCDWIQPGGAHPPGADDIVGLAAWLAAL